MSFRPFRGSCRIVPHLTNFLTCFPSKSTQFRGLKRIYRKCNLMCPYHRHTNNISITMVPMLFGRTVILKRHDPTKPLFLCRSRVGFSYFSRGLWIMHAQLLHIFERFNVWECWCCCLGLGNSLLWGQPSHLSNGGWCKYSGRTTQPSV